MQTNLKDVVSHPWWTSRESLYIRWYPKTLVPTLGLIGDPIDADPPRGAYIHVPFCDRLCRFCPFNKRETDAAQVSQFVAGLIEEIRTYASLVRTSNPLRFIYFGGGTPSVLSPGQVGAVLEALARSFGISPDAEVSAEVHPTHLRLELLGGFRAAGVTRVSTGAQSFDDSLLKSLGAHHTGGDVRTGLAMAARVFTNVAIDLLFRCPGQSLEQWQSALATAASIDGVSHMSLYSLVLRDVSKQPDTYADMAMTLAAFEHLERAGMHHYASCASGGFDFAYPAAECVYELEHWRAPQASFLGLGPGALGYFANGVTVNGLGIERYCSETMAGRLPIVSHHIASPDELARRYFVLGSKTMQIPFEPFAQAFGVDPRRYFVEEFAELEQAGMAEVRQEGLLLTDLGRVYVDSVSAVFFSRTERTVPHPEEPEIRRAEIVATRKLKAAPNLM